MCVHENKTGNKDVCSCQVEPEEPELHVRPKGPVRENKRAQTLFLWMFAEAGFFCVVLNVML